MIKIGARGHDYGKSTPQELFRRIRKDGFESLQLAFKKAIQGVDQFSDITPDVVKTVKESLKQYGLHTAVLGVYIDPALVHNSAKREADVAEFIASIPIAKELGVDCIGTETTHTSAQPDVTRKEALDTLYRSLWEIMPEAERQDVTVAIEPVYYHTVNTPELAREVLKTVASPNLKIIFDAVNVLSPEEIPNQDRLWARSFDCLGENIAAVHMKGAVCGENGSISGCAFSESLVHYDVLFHYLRQLPQDFSVLREEVDPAHGAEDFRFLKSLTEQ
ncbi:MAG TPA: sugar phosphate isomerase/epimerase [Clostridiales bacterium]|nr:sugar phosphate isomerase/epimerase [Clostridiales bacterium]